MPRLAASVTCLMIAISPARGADWIKGTSANFEIYSSSSEADARETLSVFEQTRDFFRRVRPMATVSELPVTLVQFGTAREYRPFSPKENTPAFFTTDLVRDIIVMSDLKEMRNRAAVHEYVHILVRHSGLKIPVWLNEGMADVYSTLKSANGTITVGATIKDRTYSLISDKWMRLPDLLAVTSQSPAYNENERVGIFYAQSWLLAHMLMLGETYAGKFPAFVERLSESGSAQAAFADVYKQSVAEVQTAMNAYYRGTTIGAATYEGTLQAGAIGPFRPAAAAQVDFTLARITAAMGRTEEANRKLQQLAAADPENYEIDEVRAYLAVRNADRDGGLRFFEAAIEHGTPNPKTKADYELLKARGKISLSATAPPENPALPPEEGDVPPPRPVLKRAGKQK